MSPAQWALLATLAILGQVVAWLLIHHGSSHLSTATTGSLLLVQPVLTLAMSTVGLHEHPNGLQWLGAVTILAAVLLLNRAPAS